MFSIPLNKLFNDFKLLKFNKTNTVWLPATEKV